MDKKTYNDLMNYLVKGKLYNFKSYFQWNAKGLKKIDSCYIKTNNRIFSQVVNSSKKDLAQPLKDLECRKIIYI